MYDAPYCPQDTVCISPANYGFDRKIWYNVCVRLGKGDYIAGETIYRLKYREVLKTKNNSRTRIEKIPVDVNWIFGYNTFHVFHLPV